MAHHLLSIFRRRLFNFLTILSLILYLASVALWVRSSWRWDDLIHFSADTWSPDSHLIWHSKACVMSSNFGEMAFHVEHENPPHSNSLTRGWNRFFGFPAEPDHTYRSYAKMGIRSFSILNSNFGYTSDGSTPTNFYSRTIWFPHWFLALFFAILPTIRLVLILRNRHRHRAGFCQHCGYDLRATPDRCPECGRTQSPPANSPRSSDLE